MENISFRWFFQKNSSLLCLGLLKFGVCLFSLQAFLVQPPENWAMEETAVGVGKCMGITSVIDVLCNPGEVTEHLMVRRTFMLLFLGCYWLPDNVSLVSLPVWGMWIKAEGALFLPAYSLLWWAPSQADGAGWFHLYAGAHWPSAWEISCPELLGLCCSFPPGTPRSQTTEVPTSLCGHRGHLSFSGYLVNFRTPDLQPCEEKQLCLYWLPCRQQRAKTVAWMGTRLWGAQ